jgi:hypothetical protein
MDSHAAEVVLEKRRRRRRMQILGPQRSDVRPSSWLVHSALLMKMSYASWLNLRRWFNGVLPS